MHIWTRTGRKPLMAGGNADGDTGMLEIARLTVRSTSGACGAGGGTSGVLRPRSGSRLRRARLAVYSDMYREKSWTGPSAEN